jgi:hypothetical protein
MKSIKLVLLAAVLLFVVGCADKKPFAKQEPLENAGLVYLYVVPDGAFESNPNYKVRINGKRVEGRVKKGEYTVFNLKPTNSLKITVVKREIEEKSVTLDIIAGQINYIKVKGSSSEGLTVVHVPNSVGSKEIVKMGLAGSVIDESVNEAIEELIPEKKKAPLVQAAPSASKVEQIEKAHALKEKGILSEEEYKKLKTEILSK